MLICKRFSANSRTQFSSLFSRLIGTRIWLRRAKSLLDHRAKQPHVTWKTVSKLDMKCMKELSFIMFHFWNISVLFVLLWFPVIELLQNADQMLKLVSSALVGPQRFFGPVPDGRHQYLRFCARWWNRHQGQLQQYSSNAILIKQCCWAYVTLERRMWLLQLPT